MNAKAWMPAAIVLMMGFSLALYAEEANPPAGRAPDAPSVIEKRGQGSRAGRREQRKEQLLREQGKLPPPRQWKPWDADIGQRLGKPAYLAGKTIRTGSLPPAAVNALKEQEAQIAALGNSLKPGEKVGKEQCAQLRQLLEETSKLIYGGSAIEKPKLNDALVKKMEEGEITGAEGKELCAQLQRVRELKRALGGDPTLRPEQRPPLEGEFNALAAILHQ